MGYLEFCLRIIALYWTLNDRYMKRIYGKIVFMFFASLADGLFGQSASMVERITNLPVLDRNGIKVGYEGSIDKKGKNEDWN